MGALSFLVPNVEYCKCCECGVEFASPVLRSRRSDGQWFYCPNGHRQHFTDTNEMRLERETKWLRDELDFTRRNLNTEREARKWAKAEARRNATILRKVKQWVANGVCPCCNRHFINLERHMETKHPKFSAEASA